MKPITTVKTEQVEKWKRKENKSKTRATTIIYLAEEPLWSHYFIGYISFIYKEKILKDIL